jgi:hypothetical protein
LGNRRWRRGGVLAAALLAAASVFVLLIGPGQASSACQPVFPAPNRPNGLDLAYLKAHSQHMAGDLALGSAAVTNRFTSRDPRNFAVDVSVGEYATAFGLPATDAQNVLYGLDPGRRVILVFSYGDFVWTFSGDSAASVPHQPRDEPYRVGMAAVDAQTGSLSFGQTPVCK